MNRQGSVLLWCLVLLALAGVVLQAGVQRWRTYQQGQQPLIQQQQAREWALGADLLARGTTMEYGAWQISHGSDGVLRARLASGQGWWLRREGDLIVAEGPLPQALLEVEPAPGNAP